MSLTLPTSHIVNSTRIQDYVLGLLSDEERLLLERHADGCPVCAAALRRERELGVLVEATVRQAARMDPARLRALRPAPPARPRLTLATRQLALVGALLLLFMSAISLTQRENPAWLPYPAAGAPTQVAQPTATETQLPTLTASPTAPQSVMTPAPAGFASATAPPATPVVRATFTRP